MKYGTRLATGIVALLLAARAVAGFDYYSPISINSGQVPSTQTDFPVLVSVTDARFKTVANSGHVQNANGYDIRPYSDTGLTTAITGYELERYNASTGEVVMWVRVSSLSSSTTPIYLAYGDSGISTDGSSTTTWSNGFLGVYHLKDGTTLDVNSSTGSNNGTNHSATATTGQIDGAGGFASASSQYINLGSGMSSFTAVTASAWVKATSFPSTGNPVIEHNNPSNPIYTALRVHSTGKLDCYVHGNADISYVATGSHTLSTGTWYYLTLTYSSTAGLIGYVNAASDNTVAANGTLTVGASTDTYIGSSPNPNTIFWNGTIDEARLANVARSADWITTEYNNQSAPGTFETLGAETTLVNSGLFFPFIQP